MLLVGARYACPRCLRRGPTRKCSRCAKPGFDLEEPPGAALLQKALLKSELRPSGSMAALWDRQSGTSKVEWGVALLATLVGGIAMFRDANTGLGGPMVLLGIPIFLAFLALIRLIVFLGSLVLRLGLMTLVLALALVALVVEVVLMKLTSAQCGGKVSGALLKGLPLLWVGLFTRFTLAPMKPTIGAPTFTGNLDRKLEIRSFVGRTGDAEFADALPIELLVGGGDGEQVRVTLEAGGIDLGDHGTTGAVSEVAAPDDDGVERATLSLTHEGPSWLRQAPVHGGGRHVSRKGTRVSLHGGAWEKAGEARSLRGTHEQPLWAVFG